MKDIDYRQRKKEAIAKKSCGNGIRIRHENGWFTQYCHMRKNSVKVEKGQKVRAGETLGFVGNSGYSIYPHLGFRVNYVSPDAASRSGSIVDPFVGVKKDQDCRPSSHALWPDHVLERLTYQDLSIIDSGFAPSRPKPSALVQGLYDDETLSIRSPQLFLWARFLYVKKGDKVTFEIKGPDGEEVLNYSNMIEKDQAYTSLHAGVRRPSLNWDSGTYEGAIKLVRTTDGQSRVYRTEASISMR